MKKAFTIIEFLIVGAIIAMLVGTSVPMSIQNRNRKAVDEATTKIEGALVRARDYALAGRKVRCTGTLLGWGVYVYGNEYSLAEVCDVGGELWFEENMPISDDSNVTVLRYENVLFQPLGKGVVHPYGITVLGHGYQRVIDVTQAGQITVGNIQGAVSTVAPPPTSSVPSITPTRTPTPFPSSTIVPTPVFTNTPVPPTNTPIPPTPTPTYSASHAPACSGVTLTACVNANGTITATATNVIHTTLVKFATWSQVFGQDDLVWYNGTNLGGGAWQRVINQSSHNGSDIYVDVYMDNGTAFVNRYCGGGLVKTPCSNQSGLAGKYFSGTTLHAGSLKMQRVDSTVNFNWGTGTPNAQVPADGFSVRWSGKVIPKVTGTNSFYLNADDGVRMWVNGVQIINSWVNTPGLRGGHISLVANNQYDIVVEFYENTGGASISMSWEGPGLAREVIPSTHLRTP